MRRPHRRPARELPRASATAAAAAADVLASLLASLPIPHRLRDIGLAQADLDVIASAAMSDFFISRSPQRVQDAADVRGILDAAW
jgi:alcohol dehydrogenase class IV